MQGIGALLVGIAAIIALCQTGSVLEKIFQLQKKAEEIQTAVLQLKSAETEIQVGIVELKSAVALIGKLVIQVAARLTANNLKEPNITKDEINDVLKKIPDSPDPCQATVYLPSEKRDKVINQLQNSLPQQREFILQNALEYKSMHDLKNCAPMKGYN